ncbi:MAG: hypothetical protein HOH19_09055 [Kordiimonadaceae bacterium]|jgi:hypothetical protein|nr:hypothetical protein [Kordiimonadaceae bacterium]MBT6032711.1 hypothetical protein [Kordiimonadaceae bacterium]
MSEIGNVIKVRNSMQQDYQYELVEYEGKNFADDFKPHFTPKEMLSMGVFEGKYLNSCTEEYPSDWFEDALLSDKPNLSLNHFSIKSRQPISIWRKKGWIMIDDPRGWFEWYCRYYRGRRHKGMDQMQIKRWRGFSRHAGQIRANCEPGDIWCRPRQRQALLQWAHDPFI